MVVNLNSNIRFYPVIFGNAKVDRFFLTTKINANYFAGSFKLATFGDLSELSELSDLRE